MKNFIAFIFIFIFVNLFSQISSKSINFEVYYEKDYPLAGGNLVEKNLNILNGTTTDFNGKDNLIISNYNSEFELTFTGPIVRFKIPEKTEKIIINIDKRRIEYYHNDKIFKRKRLKFKGFSKI